MSDWAVRVYRLAARIMGLALCRHEIVESVYANRGVGRGEIAFGRSDIDLSIITRTPDPETGDAAELLSLYRRVCVLRRINPALTHMMLYDLRGLDRFPRADSYMGSQERRSMFLLAGRPAPIPVVPVRRIDAVRYVPFWCDRLFPMAIAQKNRRNLRKVTIEIWKSWAVARGIVAEPYLTLREGEQKARSHPAGSGLAEAIHDPRRSVEFVMKLADMLHDELLPPLEKLREPMILRQMMPPRSKQRILIILPHAEASLPAEGFEAQAFIATPELLDLSLHYFNPFLEWSLPPELKRLGFSTPKPIEFVRACLLFGQENTLRLPGFARSETWLPHAISEYNEYSIPYLRNGDVPPPMPEDAARAALGHNSDSSEYYLNEYTRLYHRTVRQLEILERLEEPGIYPAA
ncbi:MAG: hypothetical protein JXA73_07955 [Acidobacteria bacterium]|nr:hypothetical protein [Acidobacteriota bacterium]